MNLLVTARRFADAYRNDPSPELARKLRLSRWFARHTEGAIHAGRFAVTPYVCLPFGHPDRELTEDQYYTLADWTCQKPGPF
jgi:hypothetical protein